MGIRAKYAPLQSLLGDFKNDGALRPDLQTSNASHISIWGYFSTKVSLFRYQHVLLLPDGRVVRLRSACRRQASQLQGLTIHRTITSFIDASCDTLKMFQILRLNTSATTGNTVAHTALIDIKLQQADGFDILSDEPRFDPFLCSRKVPESRRRYLHRSTNVECCCGDAVEVTLRERH